MDLQKSSIELKRKSYEGLAIVIALFALIATIVGVVIQLRAEKKRELVCNVLSSNELTSLSTVPGLTARFTYNNKEVAHVWKLTLSFVNSGNDTLIGEGSHGNLMADGISFGFPQDTEILNREVTYEDLDVAVSIEGAKNSPTPLPNEQLQTTGNKLKLRFGQWRPGERLEVALYVASANSQPAALLPSVSSRDIVDGSVVVRSLLAHQDEAKRSLIDRLPIAASVTVKFIVSIVCALLAVLGVYAVPKDIIDFFRWSRWKKKNIAEFSTFVKGLGGISDSLKLSYLEKPFRLSGDVWKSYPGDKPNLTANVLISSVFELFTLGLGLVLLGIAAGLYVITNIGDLAIFLWTRYS